MSLESNFKGAIFEWYVKNILQSCGFTQVIPNGDNNLIYTDSKGLNIHGLAQPHNADVLMNPPLQIPFNIPSRLIIECKAYNNKVGLPIVRNVLGMREDINSFEIVTPSILNMRKNYRRRHMAIYSFNRFIYQVGIAVVNQLTFPAIEFAAVHRIPIISFAESIRYKVLRDTVQSISKEYCEMLGNQYSMILDYFKGTRSNLPDDVDRMVVNFTRSSRELLNSMSIGLLESGEILFLHNPGQQFVPSKIEYDAEIHYKIPGGDWKINIIDENEATYYFELPDRIFSIWAKQEFDKRKAIEIKNEYFKRIVIISTYQNEFTFYIIRISDEFIKRITSRINEDVS